MTDPHAETPPQGHDIGEVAFGDVISDDDGILVVGGELDDLPVVVKRFASEAGRREIPTYHLLRRLGVPTLPLLGSGPDWIILEELTSAGYRRATADDLADPAIARLVAGWYDTLHAAGDTLPRTAVGFSELDLIDEAGLTAVERRWPDLAPRLAWARGRLPRWRDDLAGMSLTLTHNDFWFTNLAVSWDGSSALLYDYNLTGMGLRASDLRNVTLGLAPAAGRAFLTRYEELASMRGVELSRAAERLDRETAHLVALIMASESEDTPHWAEPSLSWARSSPKA
ncbi:hypothetical protein SAMN02745244_01378 [Tessaracoccus bendigoensis DSM 12906]|uniref:Aminoglycoside phosphotransferase domain-containing protein n=1 Tax=Tessaracoccus bendigoensis DSM 12906 TaxID=1123357 RepID=A0A1M6F8C4_9ACTN|nr:phosphotransferase [Tessaracoccus bendigoensis]SHI93935.1 hypothetical protein SAMN02745244_01378 [Tessaracoccus bendigoensis DSM 12906]